MFGYPFTNPSSPPIQFRKKMFGNICLLDSYWVS